MATKGFAVNWTLIVAWFLPISRCQQDEQPVRESGWNTWITLIIVVASIVTILTACYGAQKLIVKAHKSIRSKNEAKIKLF